jgi:hypothetical protein
MPKRFVDTRMHPLSCPLSRRRERYKEKENNHKRLIIQPSTHHDGDFDYICRRFFGWL